MKLLWAPLAIDRLEEICDYISYDKPSAAEKWIDSIFEKVGLLRSTPGMGRLVPELETSNLRELIIGNYRIIYQSTKDTVTILTVRNIKQKFSIKDIDSAI